MKHPKTVADLTYKQIVEMCIREYDFNEDYNLPSNWPVCWIKEGNDKNEAWVGDPEWMEDFLWGVDDKDGRVIGTWENVIQRIQSEPKLESALKKVDAKRLSEIYKRYKQNQENAEKRKEAERIARIKALPWISVKTEMPRFKSNEWDKQYLITNGKEVFHAHLSHNDITGTYFYALGLSAGTYGVITHWMPADRLLLFLPALEISA